MVCCDAKNCPFGKWFHLSCLKLVMPKNGIVQTVARFKPKLKFHKLKRFSYLLISCIISFLVSIPILELHEESRLDCSE